MSRETQTGQGPSFEVLGELAAELVHELRNSLQVIATQAYLGRENASRAQNSCIVIERQAAEAQAAIADVFSLAAVGGSLATQRTCLADVRDDCRRDLDPNARFADEGESLALRAHPRLFGRALRLLYDNAIGMGGNEIQTRIEVHASGASKTARVFVHDSGPGVPAHIRSTLFSPFVTSRPGGTGLGLSLAKRIAEAHGGDLELIHSEKGALFCFTLPAADD